MYCSRDKREEISLDVEGFELFSVEEFSDRIEHTFWKSVDLNIDEFSLQEGQHLRRFSEEEARATALTYGFNEIVAQSYARAPVLRRRFALNTIAVFWEFAISTSYWGGLKSI